MTTFLEPGTIPELVDAVKGAPRLSIAGAGTKPALCPGNTVILSTKKIRGVTEYECAEFTFTALAGTPLLEIETVLERHGQYLPFDPMLVLSGSTLAGAVAAGLSGPGRFRYGGIRDFILGVRFVDGEGRLLRMGSKVVKSAAGFDLPKFFTGSLGQFGVLVELTFKVFPKPSSRLTLKLATADIDAAIRILIDSGNTRWQPDAIDILPGSTSVFLRLAGPSAALEKISGEILSRWKGEVLPPEQAEAAWSEAREFKWKHIGGPLLKVPLTPDILEAFWTAVAMIEDSRIHLSAGGNMAFVSLPSNHSPEEIDKTLSKLGLTALVLEGVERTQLGLLRHPAILASVKKVLDPANRFPPYETQ
jgi:glycolate oxidase FAD binding subunit